MIRFLSGLHVTKLPIRLMCPMSVLVWFPASNSKTVWPIDSKLGIEVELHHSLCGIALGDNSCIANWEMVKEDGDMYCKTVSVEDNLHQILTSRCLHIIGLRVSIYVYMSHFYDVSYHISSAKHSIYVLL